MSREKTILDTTDFKRRVRDLAIQFVRFASVGGVGTCAHYAVLVTLVEVIDAGIIIASSFGFMVGALVNYGLNYRYTFKSDSSHSIAMPKFYTIALIGFLLNGVIMKTVLEFTSLNYIVIQFLATGIVLVWNFIGSRWWIFGPPKSS